MRSALIALLAIVGIACAEPSGQLVVDYRYGTGALGTINVTVTNTETLGYVQEIIFDHPGTAGVTSWLSVAAVNPITGTSTVLASNGLVAADMVFKPRFDATDAAGAALTSDPPEPYLIAGERIVCTITNISVSTGNLWRVYVKSSKETK